jgi:drug/metabolite transporter superfamily protein YnfA
LANFESHVVERQIPTRADLLGAALAIVGALVIIGFARRSFGLRFVGSPEP